MKTGPDFSYEQLEIALDSFQIYKNLPRKESIFIVC